MVSSPCGTAARPSLRLRGRRLGAMALVAGAALVGTFLCGLTLLKVFVPSPGSPRNHRIKTARSSSLIARAAMKMQSVNVKGEVVPLGTHILVKQKEASDVSKGGILLAKKDKPREGDVIAVGAGEANEDTGVLVPVSVEAGSKVMYSSFGGVEIEVNDEDHVLLRDADVLLSYDGDEPTLENAKMPRGRVLVRLLKAEEETQSGLLLAKGVAQDSTDVGEVMLVGDGEVLKDGSNKPPEVEKGDMVRFRFGDEVKLDIGDGKFSSVKAANCIAKWKPA